MLLTKMQLQLTREQHGFELSSSSYSFFNKYDINVFSLTIFFLL